MKKFDDTKYFTNSAILRLIFFQQVKFFATFTDLLTFLRYLILESAAICPFQSPFGPFDEIKNSL